MRQIARLWIMGAAALCMVITAYGDIYDDAIFWFRGGTNVTANGRTAVKGDFFGGELPARVRPPFGLLRGL